MDDDRSGTIDKNEFKKACKDFRFELDDRETKLAFEAFDRDGNGLIDYEEFLAKLRVKF